MIRLTLLAALLTLAQPAFAQGEAAYEQEAERAFENLAPVGMAVAVVRDGKIEFLRGYGRLAADQTAAVDGDTVFPIHSMTKSFAAAALALLVDEGKIAWSDPVKKHIPEFAMSDPYVTEHLTVRDLLVHNSGLALGAGDLLSWPDQTSTAAETIAALRHLPLESGFREKFTYDNILYTVAGEVVARVSGQPWGAFVEQRLFAPLEMTSCSTSSAKARAVPTAIQHARPAGGSPAPLREIVLLEDPAGSISCSVRDVARWTAFQLGEGSLPDGTRLLSPQRIEEMHTPVVTLGARSFMRRLGGAHFNDYALGWFASDFAGTLAIWHGGMGPGGLTEMIMLPDKEAAVIVLTNDMVPATFLAYHLADRIARGEAASDWIEWAIESGKRRAARAQGQSSEAAPPANAVAPALPLRAYAGTYRDAWYGDIEVGHGAGGLTIHLTRSKLLNGPLLPWDGETFLARWPERSLEADALVTFQRDDAGRVTGMKVRKLSERTDFSYDYEHLNPVRVN